MQCARISLNSLTMKTFNTIYMLVALVVLAGAILNVLHIVESNYIVIFGLVTLTFFQSWYIKKLNKKIVDLERSGPEN